MEYITNTERDMYIFNREVLNIRLIKYIRDNYDSIYDREINILEKTSSISLVPFHTKHQYEINGDKKWHFKNEIEVTKEQVDKFLNLKGILDINFVGFISIYGELL